MSLLLFYASAGGADFEGGIPDLDLKLGIGYHRNFINYSFVYRIICEFVLRNGFELLNKSYENLHSHDHIFWCKFN